MLLTPNAGLGKKEEEGDKEAKSLKVDISLPKRSISVNVTQKMTTEYVFFFVVVVVTFFFLIPFQLILSFSLLSGLSSS